MVDSAEPYHDLIVRSLFFRRRGHHSRTRVPSWTYLPAAQVIECMTRHVAHLYAHTHTIVPTTRDHLTLIARSCSYRCGQ
jgi:hypothetical protein